MKNLFLLVAVFILFSPQIVSAGCFDTGDSYLEIISSTTPSCLYFALEGPGCVYTFHAYVWNKCDQDYVTYELGDQQEIKLPIGKYVPLFMSWFPGIFETKTFVFSPVNDAAQQYSVTFDVKEDQNRKIQFIGFIAIPVVSFALGLFFVVRKINRRKKRS